jgi:hypothetical protein
LLAMKLSWSGWSTTCQMAALFGDSTVFRLGVGNGGENSRWRNWTQASPGETWLQPGRPWEIYAGVTPLAKHILEIPGKY